MFFGGACNSLICQLFGVSEELVKKRSKKFIYREILKTEKEICEIQLITWPKSMSEKDIEEYKQMFERSLQRKRDITVLYDLHCDCQRRTDFVLDRYPMSEKILLVQCRICKNYVDATLVKPIQFFCPVREMVFGLEELKDYFKIDGHKQAEFLKMYAKQGVE